MRKRSGKQGGEDMNETAFRVVMEAIGESPVDMAPVKNIHASALGRLGGLKGGKERASRMTPEERSESARKAAAARWAVRSESISEDGKP
jgi:hypothetical protein